MYYTLKDLRSAGLKIQEIADILGYTKDAVHKALNETHREFRFTIRHTSKVDDIIGWDVVNFGEYKLVDKTVTDKIKGYKK